MGQPVKLSDELVDDARAVGPGSQRSIAGQIEFWAALGRSIEPLLRSDRALALRSLGAERPLSSCIQEIASETGRVRLQNTLAERPFPHYHPIADRPGLLRRIDAAGSQTVGRFNGRTFVVEPDQP